MYLGWPCGPSSGYLELRRAFNLDTCGRAEESYFSVNCHRVLVGRCLLKSDPRLTEDRPHVRDPEPCLASLIAQDRDSRKGVIGARRRDVDSMFLRRAHLDMVTGSTDLALEGDDGQSRTVGHTWGRPIPLHRDGCVDIMRIPPPRTGRGHVWFDEEEGQRDTFDHRQILDDRRKSLPSARLGNSSPKLIRCQGRPRTWRRQRRAPLPEQWPDHRRFRPR